MVLRVKPQKEVEHQTQMCLTHTEGRRQCQIQLEDFSVQSSRILPCQALYSPAPFLENWLLC